MKSYGPFSADPTFYPDKQSLNYTVSAGKSGFIEFINLSFFDLQIQLPNGIITIEQRSKTIWPVPPYVQGQLPLQIRPQLLYQLQAAPSGTPFFLANPVGGTASILWINTYEEGEIQWYAPVSLGSVYAGAAFFATSNANPPSITVGPFAAYPNSPIFLWGMDFTSTAASAGGGTGNITISGLISGSMEFRVQSVGSTPTPTPAPMFPRWTPPLQSTAGGSIVVSGGAIPGANMSTTIFYTVP